MTQMSSKMQALRYWLSGEGVRCLEELANCQVQDPEDIAVLNNTAVVKCDVSDRRSMEETLDMLESLKVDTAGQAEGNMDGTNVVQQSNFVVLYNKAVLKMRRHRVDEGVTLLESLFAKVHTVENGLAAAVCFLLMDCYLERNDALRCEEIMQFLERLFPQETHPYDKSPIPWEASERLDDTSDDSGSDALSTGLRADATALAYPSTSVLNAFALEITTDNGMVSHEEGIPCDDFAAMVLFYRARILLSIRHLTEAKKQVNLVLAKAPSSIPALFLKAQIYFVKKKYHKASLLLNRCVDDAPEGSELRSVLLNNMGAVQYRLGNIDLACLCFSRALQVDSDTTDDDQLRTSYNMGIVALRQSRYEDALTAFKHSSKAMYSEPCLWVRMAECCIALFERVRNKTDLHIENTKTTMIEIPSLVVLPAGDHTHSEELFSKDGWMGKAYAYLQNALALLQHNDDSDSTDGVDAAERRTLRSAVYLKLAFVTLTQNRPERCLMFIDKLGHNQNIDSEMALCAMQYEVEALCLMDKPKDATAKLKAFVESFDEADVEPRTAHGAHQQHRCNCQKMMYQNLASMYCLNQDFAHAKYCIQKAMLFDPGCRKSLMLHVYIELAAGNNTVALQMLQGRAT